MHNPGASDCRVSFDCAAAAQEYCPRGDLLELLLAENRAFSEERVAQVAISLLQTFQVRCRLLQG